MSKSKPVYAKDNTQLPRYVPLQQPHHSLSDKQVEVLLNNLTERINAKFAELHRRIDALEGQSVIVDLNTSTNKLEFVRGVLQDDNYTP